MQNVSVTGVVHRITLLVLDIMDKYLCKRMCLNRYWKKIVLTKLLFKSDLYKSAYSLSNEMLFLCHHSIYYGKYILKTDEMGEDGHWT